MNITSIQTPDNAPKIATQRGRFPAGIIALIAFAALAVQPLLGEGSYLENLGGMLRYFTIWGNFAACLVMTAIAFGLQVSRPIMAAVATALAIIALVYWVLLSGIHNPEGYERITNQFHHTIVPALTIAWWLRFTPAAPSTKAMIPAIMVPPLSYAAFALVLGQVTGFYPYFFTDLPALGWPLFLVSNAAFALFFAVSGAGLVTLKNALQSRFSAAV